MTLRIPIIYVYPTKSSSLYLKHPTHGPMVAEGVYWPKDNYTCRRLSDGSVTVVAPVKADGVPFPFATMAASSAKPA